MRIAVTGATGNAGTALLRRLREAGHEVVGVCRRPPASGPYADAAEWVGADLASDDAVPLLRQAMTGADAVVHLVWGFQPSHRPDHLRNVGVGGTRRMLRAALEAAVPHVVHQSSLGVYSPKRSDEPVTEDWPREGIPRSPYSQHKVAAELLLDSFEEQNPEVTVARVRPGVIGQRRAGSSLLRYGLPAYVPAAVLRLVPVLPLDRGFVASMVHADDVADAIVRMVEQRAGGAFNLAAPTPITRGDVARTLGAVPVHAPAPLLRAAVSASWRAHLQPVDPGWVDLAFRTPLLDPTRARDELAWQPRWDAPDVLAEVVAGMRAREDDATEVLRPRTLRGELWAAARRGLVSYRREA